MTGNSNTKAVVTVAEMARMVGLSRQRFYQLIGTTFPEPKRNDKGRPFYDEELQRVCLEVRRRNYGIDGKPILFYAPRHSITHTPVNRPRSPQKRKIEKKQDARYEVILDGVRGLGLATATMAQVAAVMKQQFLRWEPGDDPSELIRQVFLSIKRQDSSDNVG